MITDVNCKIITGQYPKSDEASQKFLKCLFGPNAEYRYELYFHWYNLIHELGHAIMMFNNSERPHPAEEEQLVNDFAAAYWRHYGEQDKLRDLEDTVTDALSRLPALTDGDYLEYAKAHWGEEMLWTFEGYGWFQFNSVGKALSRQHSLEEALGSLCCSRPAPQTGRELPYAGNEDLAETVVADAVSILSAWGVTLPRSIPVEYSDDVNCHMFVCDHYDEVRAEVLQEQGIQ